MEYKYKGLFLHLKTAALSEQFAIDDSRCKMARICFGAVFVCDADLLPFRSHKEKHVFQKIDEDTKTAVFHNRGVLCITSLSVIISKQSENISLFHRHISRKKSNALRDLLLTLNSDKAMYPQKR